MYLPPFVTIPENQRKNYQLLRVVLYIFVILFVATLAIKALFPTLSFSFDFRNPGASKNTLLNPRAPDGTERNNGKIEANGIFLANASNAGDFSHANLSLSLEKESEVPASASFLLRRSYRDFWLPDGEAVTSFPSETLYVVNGTYYALRDNTLY